MSPDASPGDGLDQSGIGSRTHLHIIVAEQYEFHFAATALEASFDAKVIGSLDRLILKTARTGVPVSLLVMDSNLECVGTNFEIDPFRPDRDAAKNAEEK